MKSIVLLCLVAYALAEEQHTTLNDYHDIESVIKDPVELKEYLDCFLEKGPCHELLLSFRKNMPEAVPEICRRCNDGQKHMWRVFLDGIKATYPDGYLEYRKKYDPTGTVFDTFEAEIYKY